MKNCKPNSTFSQRAIRPLRVLALLSAALATLPTSLDASAQPNKPRLLNWGYCKPVEVLLAAGRIHARCQFAVDGILYFALPSSSDDQRFFDKAFAMMTAAQVADVWLRINYDAEDQSAEAWGCLATNCRRIIAMTLQSAPPPPPPPTPRPVPRCTADPNAPGCPQYCRNHPEDDARCDAKDPDRCTGPNASHLPQCQ